MEAALDFKGQTVLVTGSGRNIGRVIVLEFAVRRANVVINALDTDTDRAACEAEKTEVEALGVNGLVVPGDAGGLKTIETLKAQVEAAFPGQ
jgi:NAD(P)-dependent dehydrogenase (short-subunit alcohol dehydrogenase family)